MTEYRRNELLLTSLVAGGVALLHALGTWRHLTTFWGDYGYMLDLVSRAHAGSVPYRDYHWPYPPLSIWIAGAATRVTGIDLTGVWTFTVAMYAAIVATFIWFVRLVAPPGTQAAVAGTGMLLGVALANNLSAPLPLGTYSPAGPIGFVCLFIAGCAALRFITDRRTSFAILASIAAGLAVLTKHDYWIPAAYVVAVCAWDTLFSRSRPRSWGLAAAAIAPAALVFLAGAAVIVAQTDFAMLLDIGRGFGLIDQQAGRGGLALETLTIEVIVLASIFGLYALARQLALPKSDRTWRASALAGVIAFSGLVLWLGQAYRIGHAISSGQLTGRGTQFERAMIGMPMTLKGFLRTAADALIDRGVTHVLPMLLPLVIVAVLFYNRSRLAPDVRKWLLLLVGFAITLRLRRQFEFTEWFSVLVELPLYAALVAALFNRPVAAQRTIVAGCALFAVIGFVAYYRLGRGALTARGVQPVVESSVGTFRTAPDLGATFRMLTDALDDLDPSGLRPVFGSGYTNGYNYFTGRPYPAHAPIGFRSTARSRPDSTVRAVLASSPASIVIDNPFYERMRIRRGLYWHRWSLPLEPSPDIAQARADFKQVVDRCRVYRRLGDGPNALVVYDCAGAAETSVHMGSR